VCILTPPISALSAFKSTFILCNPVKILADASFAVKAT
jgi:hypothetical protein